MDKKEQANNYFKEEKYEEAIKTYSEIGRRSRKLFNFIK